MRQRARTHDDILRSVIRVYATDGGTGAMIELIAADAGLSRATLYSYFPGGVDELVSAAYDLLGHEFVAESELRLQGVSDWRARILTHAQIMVDWGTDPHRGVFYNIVGPRLLSGSHAHGIGSQCTLRLVESELSRVRSEGVVDPSIDPASVAALLTSCVKVIGFESAQENNRSPQLVRAFQALIDGLLA